MERRSILKGAIGLAVAGLATVVTACQGGSTSAAATPAPIRISLYRSLATSAKFHGNHLDGNQVNDLQQVVTSEKNLDIRSAAAEARGALNLSAQSVQPLILQRND